MRKVARWPADPTADIQDVIARVDLKQIGDLHRGFQSAAVELVVGRQRLYAWMTRIDTVLRQRRVQTVAETTSAVMPGNVEIGIHRATPLLADLRWKGRFVWFVDCPTNHLCARCYWFRPLATTSP